MVGDQGESSTSDSSNTSRSLPYVHTPEQTAQIQAEHPLLQVLDVALAI